MARESLVKVVGLEKTFKNFWGKPKAKALTNINFDIKQGDVFAMLGPNGSGKSTTIKLILGLLKADKGIVSVFDRAPSSNFVKSKIGYLPEETVLYAEMTAYETLIYLGSLFGIDKVTLKTRAEQLLAMTGLTHAKDRKVGEFSKGMARRIGLAQALINDPELIILDEPTSGLDPIGCREVKDLIIFLAKQGKTVIVSSHLLSDIQDICDYCLILYGGQIQAQGKIEELLKIETETKISFPTEYLEQIISKLPEFEEFLKIGNPHQNLEGFFLNIVRQASEKIESSGARGSSGFDNYLNKKLLDELISVEEEVDEPVVDEFNPDTLINLVEENVSEEVVEAERKDFSNLNDKLSDLVK